MLHKIKKVSWSKEESAVLEHALKMGLVGKNLDNHFRVKFPNTERTYNAIVKKASKMRQSMKLEEKDSSSESDSYDGDSDMDTDVYMTADEGFMSDSSEDLEGFDKQDPNSHYDFDELVLASKLEWLKLRLAEYKK